MVIVVMGVSGAGKTTFGRALARRLGWPFHEGDDLHPDVNVRKMKRDEPLSDADRRPWLERVRDLAAGVTARGANAVVTCSCLKRAYRELVRGADVRFVYLALDQETAEQRVGGRRGHFFDEALVASQFAALEPPRRALTLDATRPVEALVDEALSALSRPSSAPARPSVEVTPQSTMLVVDGAQVCDMPYTELTPDLRALEREVTRCRRCPRLVAWRERVAREKRRAFADEEYWGRPVPGWGDPAARLLVVGLAPAAHGANRTGRMFTGDESGRWFYRALWRAGFANRPDSTRRGDGLALAGCFVSAAVRCAPPDNRPTPAERESCRSWIEAEIDLLPRLAVVVALGGFAYDHVLRIWRGRGYPVPAPKPAFAHGLELELGPGAPRVLASYHPSQQNTFTGILTEAAFDRIFARAREILAEQEGVAER